MKKSLFFLLAIPLIFSCSGDEDAEPDYRAESAGSYTYIVKLESAVDGKDLGSDNGVLKVSSGASSLTFDEGTDGELSFVTLSLLEASNGYGFNIGTELFYDSDNDPFQFVGINTTSIGNTKKHGRYDSGSKQIHLTFQSDYLDDEYDEFNVIFTVTASKVD